MEEQSRDFKRGIGALSLLRNTCGKPNCKCAQGEKHESLNVSQSRNGKIHSRRLPKVLREQVVQWIEIYHEIQKLLEELSQEFPDIALATP